MAPDTFNSRFSPETAIANPEEIKGWYQEIKKYFDSMGLELTMAEAAYLRQCIAECLHNNATVEYPGENTIDIREAIYRFFLGYYGINLEEYIKPWKTGNNSEADRKRGLSKLAQIIKSKFRPEQELL